VYGTPPHGPPGSIVTVILHRLVLVVVAILGILVLLPALVSAAGSHAAAIV
jgi:hypothetical protein